MAGSARNWLSSMREVAGFKRPLDWLKIVADGNLFVTIFEKGPTGKLVGTDAHGNKYYEDEGTSYNRKRWVVYSDLTNYNASVVPPEWHGWLNYINDFAPTAHDFKRPVYAIEAGVTKTGTPAAYQPKGSWTNAHGKRNWLKYEAWAPQQKA
ncbi:NADH dehydrogenase [ubiquinone] 1 alpha subcomplex subunit 12 [Scenedesmus sp. PABB004]|nr:NADH dehydrogenase [ubiquinone] 1 alpha subcomplex subunit 12 [Scenedesmus sp. PABB004]